MVVQIDTSGFLNLFFQEEVIRFVYLFVYGGAGG